MLLNKCVPIWTSSSKRTGDAAPCEFFYEPFRATFVPSITQKLFNRNINLRVYFYYYVRYFQGAAIQDPAEEEGEVCEPGSKDKFDIKKILDYPGFNVPASSRYKEVNTRFHLPSRPKDCYPFSGKYSRRADNNLCLIVVIKVCRYVYLNTYDVIRFS